MHELWYLRKILNKKMGRETKQKYFCKLLFIFCEMSADAEIKQRVSSDCLQYNLN